jgi:hypothetical protein
MSKKEGSLLMSNSNYNRNEHDGSDNNEQSTSRVHGGELRNGRLSQIKNHNPQNEDTPNEYVNDSMKDSMNESVNDLGIPGMDA